MVCAFVSPSVIRSWLCVDHRPIPRTSTLGKRLGIKCEGGIGALLPPFSETATIRVRTTVVLKVANYREIRGQNNVGLRNAILIPS